MPRLLLSSVLLLLLVLVFASAEDESLPDGVVLCSGGKHWCMNGGQCIQGVACSCTGYFGAHCEFAVGQHVPKNCTRDCSGHGTCVVGLQSWQQLVNLTLSTNTSTTSYLEQQPPESLSYCHCESGYSGENCERKAQVCGSDYCYNGGTCVNVITESGSTASRCDCTTAIVNRTHYGGTNCEFPATSYCNLSPDQNGRQFCLNGGTCKGESHLGCSCPDGYVGPICEFQKIDRQYPPCKLPCQNFGVCRKGAKDTTFLEKFGIGRNLQNDSFSDDFEHCVCPPGYAGLQCEYKVAICPGGTTACMNGGKCTTSVFDNDSLEFSCDCSTASTATNRFAGEYCEVPSTEFCTTSGLMTSSGPGYDAFCTNDGTCKDLVKDGEPHPGCDCNNGYSGSHCEIEASNAVDRSTDSNDKIKIASWVVGAMALTLILTMACLISRKRSHKQRMAMLDLGDSSPPTLAHIREISPDGGHPLEFSSLTSPSYGQTTESEVHNEADFYDVPLSDSNGAFIDENIAFDETEEGNATLMKYHPSAEDAMGISVGSSGESDVAHVFDDSNDESSGEPRNFVLL